MINVEKIQNKSEFRVEQKLKSIESELQSDLDSTAQAKGYDNINSIAKYQGFDNAFRKEAESLGVWVADVWQVAFKILTDWQKGDIAEPTLDEIKSQLPKAPK